MVQKLQIDRWLFSATIGLALFGVVMVYSASAVIAQQENHSQFHYLIKQGLWTSIGLVAMFVAMNFDYQKLNRRWIVYGLLLVTVLLLLAVFGFRPINGARRWIRFSSFSLQPSEIAKLALVVFLARFLERREGDEASFFRTFVPGMLVIGLLAGLVIKEPDLGTALMLAIVGIAVCFAAGVRPRHVFYASVPALLYVGKMLIFTPFRMRRLASFIDPWADAQGAGYQTVQSLIAVGSGGTHGLGFAQGRQ
ncbi:MAG TPA: FtsW/RodA/SpoVE family cell cycle protein, partial [Pyrinomonadaceae bacterium]|nr:FtsW/RodA/SpoVE family cell cycle protein [Pyrinomonadaceae bacterium]